MSKLRLWILAAIIVGAAGLRVYGIGWGLPQEFHPDEPLVVPRAIDAVTAGDWNPHYFLVPSLQTELVSAAYEVIYLGGRIGGAFRGPDDFGEWAAWHYGTLYLVGRGISVLLGVLSVLGTALLAGEMMRSSNGKGGPGESGATGWAPSIAALMLAVSPLAVASSRFITPDIPMLAFYVWSIWAMLRAMRSGSVRFLALAGFLAGLAISTKYSAAILILPLIISAAQMSRSKNGDRHEFRPGAASGASSTWWAKFLPVPVFAVFTPFRVKPLPKKARFRSVGLFLMPTIVLVAGFLLGTPYALLDMSTFLNHLAIQYGAQYQGHIGMERAGATALRMLFDMATKEGPGLIAMGLIGIGIAWVRFRRASWVVVPLLVVYLVEISRWRVYADRYLLPSLPLMAVLASLAWDAIVGRIRIPPVRFLVATVLLALIVVPPAVVSLKQAWELTLPDTRTLALQWVEQNIPPGSAILLELGGPQPADKNAPHHREPAYGIVVLPPWFSDASQGLDPSTALELIEPEYVITSSNYRARYEDPYTRSRFPGIADAWGRYYATLDSQWDVVYEIAPTSDAAGSRRVGPEIRIYRRRQPR